MDTSDKKLISRIYKELLQINFYKTADHSIGKSLEKVLHREDIQMANKHMKRCTLSFVIRESPIKATV